MQYSEIKRHIINKKYYWNYSICIITSLLLGYLCFDNLNISLLSFRDIIFWLSIFWLLTMSIGCIGLNLYRCRSFYKFYHNSLKEYNVQFIKIVIQNEDYKMQAFYQSKDATIRPFPKPANAIYIEENDFIMFFFSMHYVSLFQLVLKPIIFIKTEKELFIKDKNVNFIKKFDIIETEQNKTIIFPNKNGIKKLIIPIQQMQ